MSDENVGGLVSKWREEAAGNVSTAYEEGRVAEKLRCASQLEAALSAHGQPVVDEAWLRQAIEEFKYLAGRTDFPMQDRERWRALTNALTGHTP